MRTSDLLGSPVVDANGTPVGTLRDLRVGTEVVDGRLPVEWLVIGGHELAHRFGFVDGRTQGPALLRWLLRRGTNDDAVVVPASAVATWGPGEVVLNRPVAEAARPVEQVLHHRRSTA